MSPQDEPSSDDPSSASTDLRRLLLEKAREILRDPEEPLALRTVARRAGKSRTAPYLVFGKESEGGGLLGLKIAVAAQGAREMADRMDAAIGAHPTPLEAFHAAALALLEFVEAEPRLFRLMYGPDIAAIRHVGADGFVLHPEFQELARHRGRASDLIEVLISEAQVRGELPADPPDDGTLDDYRLRRPSTRLLHIAWSTMIGVAFLRDDELLQSVDGRISRDQGARLVVESVFGVDPQEDTRVAMSFLEAPGVDDAGGPIRMTSAPGAPPDPRPDASIAAEETFEIMSQMAAAPFAEREEEELDEGDSEPLSPLERGLPLFEGEAPKPAARQLEIPLSEALAQYSGLQRATRSRTVLSRARILWIDDHPDWIRKGVETLEHLGASVTVVETTEAAKRALRKADDPFDVILSDIARGSRPDAGVRALPALKELAPDVPVVFFVGTLDPGRPAPDGSLGITNRTNELLHLVLDALEGRRGKP